jgi:hypothetical protein
MSVRKRLLNQHLSKHLQQERVKPEKDFKLERVMNAVKVPPNILKPPSGHDSGLSSLSEHKQKFVRA